jgi:type IV pilus assembly protein PilC
MSLSQAMQDANMPSTVIHVMKIAEETGELEHCMQLLSQQFHERLEWNRKLLSILTYPMILLMTSACLLFSIAVFVLPQFTGMYDMLGVPIGKATHIVLDILHYGIPMFVGTVLIAIVVGMIYWKRINQDQEAIYKMVLYVIRLPRFGPLVRLWVSTRFTESCVILLQAGIPILDALTTLSTSNQHALISKLANKMLDRLIEGSTIQGMSEGLPFTSDFQVMLQTADHTGDLAECMRIYRQLMQREWKFQLELWTQKVQPLMIFFLGTVVCGVVLVVMLPLFDVMSQL